jgi:hypothetical protein
MTDEMRAAESLVRELAPTGLAVPIPEPLALDESEWFLTAVDKGLVEFTSCTSTCERTSSRAASRDHFETDDEPAHHLFESSNGHETVMRRELLPCIAAYARAVLDLGYDADRASLLRHHQERRSRFRRESIRLRSDAEFRSADGEVFLQVKSSGDRRGIRRLASALDADGSLSALPTQYASELAIVKIVRPRFLWLVGPNTVAPAGHVFRVRFEHDDVRFERVRAVPSPR